MVPCKFLDRYAHFAGKGNEWKTFITNSGKCVT